MCQPVVPFDVVDLAAYRAVPSAEPPVEAASALGVEPERAFAPGWQGSEDASPAEPFVVAYAFAVAVVVASAAVDLASSQEGTASAWGAVVVDSDVVVGDAAGPFVAEASSAVASVAEAWKRDVPSGSRGWIG